MQITPHIRNFLALQKITPTTMLEMQEETPQIIAEEPAFSSIECLNTLYETLRSLISRYLWKPENQRGGTVSEGTETFYQQKVEPHLKSCTSTQLQQIAKTLRVLSARWQHVPGDISERLLAKAKQISKMDEEESKPKKSRSPARQPRDIFEGITEQGDDALAKQVENGLERNEDNFVELKSASLPTGAYRTDMKFISKIPQMCCGASVNSEIIHLHPKQVHPYLQRHYEDLRKYLENQEPKTTEAVLRLVDKFMRGEVFPNQGPESLQRYQDLVKKFKKMQGSRIGHNHQGKRTQISVMPVEAFVAEKCGLGRHQTFVLCYLLDRLARDLDEPFAGEVEYRYENVLNRGQHAWAVFTPRGYEKYGIWHFDPACGVLENLCDVKAQKRLEKLYGKDAVSQEIDEAQQLIGVEQKQ